MEVSSADFRQGFRWRMAGRGLSTRESRGQWLLSRYTRTGPGKPMHMVVNGMPICHRYLYIDT